MLLNLTTGLYKFSHICTLQFINEAHKYPDDAIFSKNSLVVTVWCIAVQSRHNDFLNNAMSSELIQDNWATTQWFSSSQARDFACELTGSLHVPQHEQLGRQSSHISKFTGIGLNKEIQAVSCLRHQGWTSALHAPHGENREGERSWFSVLFSTSLVLGLGHWPNAGLKSSPLPLLPATP